VSFRLDQEIALIYPARWNAVKTAYIFCRYFPLAVAPFHLWGLVGDHDQHVCESYYNILYACKMPTVLSAQFILMLRTYAFSGRKIKILAILLIAFFGLFGVIVWVTSNELTLSFLFLAVNRSACIAVSDQPTIGEVLASAVEALDGTVKVQVHILYHMGLISIVTMFFDCLNMFFVVRHCVQRGALGPVGQNILKQGILVYVVMLVLNALAIVSFFSPYLVLHGLGSTASFSYIVPSVLSCRLVLMLRRQASPTQTELCVEYSHMDNEAIGMIAVESPPKETSGRTVPSISTDAQAQA